MLPEPLTSPQAFHQAFTQGLQQLLQYNELGSFILVLANNHFDPSLQASLTGPLAQKYQQLASEYRELLRSGRQPNAAPDDLLVFLKLIAIGLDQLQATERHQVDGWELQFNPLRALRPQRLSSARIEGLQRPFERDNFHFNKPFLQKEMVWSGELLGRQTGLFYNKFPFVEQHALLVIDPSEEKPQFLGHEVFTYLWQLAEQLGERLPGVGFGYNAYGGYASVNHLHFQLFIREQPLPVCEPRWQHNSGSEPYPLDCYRFEDRQQAWQALESLHRQQQTYNLLLMPGELYLLPRRAQGSYPHSPWTAGFTWYELSGGFATFNRDDYQQLDGETIREELGRLRLARPPL